MRPPGSPRQGDPGRLHREAAGERPPRARPQRRGSPGPIPNPAVKPAFAESTAAKGCGRAGRRVRGGRFSMLARFRARGDVRRRAACAGRGSRGDVPLRAFCVSDPDRGPHHRRRGPPTWPAFDASGACVPREWIDCFVSADGMTIARFCRGYSCFWGNSAFSLDRFPRNLGPRVRSSSRVSLILGLLLAWGAVDRVATRFLRRRYRR